MFADLQIFKAASGMARHAGTRQVAIARNMANSDSPGYRAVDVAPFSLTSDSSIMTVTRTKHIGSASSNKTPDLEPRRDVAASPDGNTVDLEREMVEAVDVHRQHERAVAIYKSAMTILRASLGRR